MRMLFKILPSSNLGSRLFSKSSVPRYTSLIRVTGKKCPAKVLTDPNCKALKICPTIGKIMEKDADHRKDSQIDWVKNFSNSGTFDVKYQTFWDMCSNIPVPNYTKNSIKSESPSCCPVEQQLQSNSKFKEISLSKNAPLCVIRSSLANSFTIPLPKRSFSTSTTALKQKCLFGAKIYNSQLEKNVQKVTITIKRNVTSGTTGCKRNPNYDYPVISKIFNTEKLLMSSDAYNQALIEAAKRRSAFHRPRVMKIQMRNAKQVVDNAIKSDFKFSKAGPSSSEHKKADNVGYKSSACADPCKGELEKVLKMQEIGKKKKNKMLAGCEPPKFKDDHTSECPTAVKKLKHKPDPGCVCSHCKNAAKGNKKGDKKEIDSNSSGKIKKPKQKDPCANDHKEYTPKCNKDPCKGIKPPSSNKKDESSKKKDPRDPCKKEKEDRDPCKRRGETLIHKNDPCASKIKDPCRDRKTRYTKKKENPCEEKQQNVPCKGENQDPCKTAKDDSCKMKMEEPCKKQKDDLCKTNKEDPCKKKIDGKDSGQKQKSDACKKIDEDPKKKEKDDPCKKKKEDPCKKPKDDPCNKDKQDPCKKPKDDPCKKDKQDPCKKTKDDPCKKDKQDPCKKSKDDPCKKEVEKPCEITKETNDPCKLMKTSPCKSDKKKEPKTDNKSASQRSSTSVCNVTGSRRETKPNCGKDKKCFSTLATSTSSITLSLPTLPSFSNRNFSSFELMRYFSSKRNDKGKKPKKDFGKKSQCKTVGTRVPPKRKPAYNPHPKDGLRQCYPTYDMDCKKLCKDASKTGCKKYASLKDTDDSKSGRKK